MAPHVLRLTGLHLHIENLSRGSYTGPDGSVYASPTAEGDIFNRKSVQARIRAALKSLEESVHDNRMTRRGDMRDGQCISIQIHPRARIEEVTVADLQSMHV